MKTQVYNLFLFKLLWFCIYHFRLASAYEVIYAVNAGGEAFTDVNNIHYEPDPCTVGTASDFGTQLLTIHRVTSKPDAYLYQTERYHTANFGYDIPIAGEGDYALVLKFCEVYFNEPNQKIFDVVLNGAHTVVKRLDIFDEVGKGVAHDEIVYFTISRGKLYFKEEESEIRSNRMRIEFVKLNRDNPKINAFVLFKGDLKGIPTLPPLEDFISDDLPTTEGSKLSDDIEEMKIEKEQPPRARKTSGPKHQNPYTMDDSTVMLPVFIAVGAFIPLLFCLCKL